MPTDRAELPPLPVVELLPQDTVFLMPARRSTVMRAPDGAWGFLVRAVHAMHPRLPMPDSKDVDDDDFVDLLAGVWLTGPPPADLHHGDVVLHIAAPASGAADRVDVELRIAQDGTWQLHNRWTDLDERWPHRVVTSIDVLILTTTPGGSTCEYRHQMARRNRLVGTRGSHSLPLLPPLDALAELIDAGLLRIGTPLFCGPHRAAVAEGGVLLEGDPVRASYLGPTTVSSRISLLLGSPVNGWHLWHTRDGRLLNERRVAHATRRDHDLLP